MQIKIYILGHFTALTNTPTFKSVGTLPFNNSNGKKNTLHTLFLLILDSWE